MKHLILALNGLALIMVLGACHKEVKVDMTSGGAPAPQETNELQISESPDDGRYNVFSVDDPNASEAEKVFYVTPAQNIPVLYGYHAVSAQSCSLGGIVTTFDLEQYDANGAVVSTRRLDWSTPPTTLESAKKYGVRAKMTGIHGCRSLFLSFAINKASN